ncbi:MAG: HEPN domain-containing protein [bacterium]
MALSRRKNEPLPDLVCFHCQQAAEKYLKAHLIFHRVRFPKSHDLMLLLDLSLESAPGLEVHRELFELLNPYSVQLRYPGEESTLEEAKYAVKTIRRIRTIFRQLLPAKSFTQGS